MLKSIAAPLCAMSSLSHVLVGFCVTFDNMNGVYKLSATPGSPAGRTFPTNFRDYPGGVEYFEVYHGP